MAPIDGFQFSPIGYIESCFKDKFGTPRQPGLAPSAISQLKLLPEYQPEESLVGLEGFSHIWLVWVFHQNKTSRFHAKVRPPRLGGRSMGLFATRTPHRPNPIGLSLVKLEKIEDGVLYFQGADLVDGTPILDVKPYLPFVESVPDAQMGWVDFAEKRDIHVNFTEDSITELVEWQKLNLQIDCKQLVIETLALDPRPLVYRGFEGQDETPYRNSHVCRLLNADIHFRFLTSELVEVTKIFIL